MYIEQVVLIWCHITMQRGYLNTPNNTDISKCSDSTIIEKTINLNVDLLQYLKISQHAPDQTVSFVYYSHLIHWSINKSNSYLFREIWWCLWWPHQYFLGLFHALVWNWSSCPVQEKSNTLLVEILL